MRVALLTTDNREHHRTYDLPLPIFGPAIEAVLQGLASQPELEVHVISCTQKPMIAPSRLGENVWFHLLEVPKIGWLRTGYQGCVRAIRKKVSELQPDLVHGQGTERECALGAVFSGFRNVVTIHGNMRQVAKALRARFGGFHWCAAKLEAFALRRSGGVFCNSAYTEQTVAPLGCRTWRVPNALRLPFFAPLPPSAANSGALLNVGVISPYKRQNELLDLADRLHAAGHKFCWQFVGAVDTGSDYGREFLRRMAVAGAAGYATYFGTKSLSELLVLMDNASALVHASAEESFGLVVAEAFARNLKLFAARVGGVPDTAEGVEGAELFELDDYAVLGEALIRWKNEGGLRPATAAAEMQQRYHPNVIARQHVEIYGQVCQGPLILPKRGS
jgi:glycosyltransferase involved in cell wall biosynthesis